MKVLRILLFTTLVILLGMTDMAIAQSNVSCPGFCTYTQGGWGSVPKGGNPGSILLKNFDAVFPAPNYLTIGCTNKLQLKSALAVRNFLPAGTTPTGLPAGILVNPVKDATTDPTSPVYTNVFAGQMVALAINIGLDSKLPDFASSTDNLRDLYIAYGPFKGLTVQQFFDNANRKIGGCDAFPGSFSQYNEAATNINENYDNCRVNGNFLSCRLEVSCSPEPVKCFGGSDGAMTALPKYGVQPYTFVWKDAVAGNVVKATGLKAGTYTVTVTDYVNQTASATCTITEPTVLVPSSNNTPIACFGGSSTVTIGATGGTAPYSGTGNFTRPAGTHTFTVTDANGCSKTTSVTITQPTQLIPTSSVTPILCFGGNTTISIRANGGTPPYRGTGDFVRPAGTYTFTVTDAKDCSATITVSISQPPLLVPAASATPIACFGGKSTVTITASGGTPAYTGTGNFERSAGGPYTFTVTDANGCSKTTSISITQPTPVEISASNTPILCFGGSSVVTIGASGGTGSYTGTGDFSRTAGTYSFTVSDANGCSSSTSVTITQPTLLVPAASATPIACFGGKSTVTVTASGGTGSYTGIGNFERSAGGPYVFTVTDENGCSKTTSISITQPTPLQISASNTPILCFGGTSVVTIGASGGTIPYTGTGNFNRSAGTYAFTVSDANGCSSSTSVTITQPTDLVPAISATPIACFGGKSTVTVSASGGTPAYTGTGNFERSAGGPYVFTVTDANNCSKTVSVTITQPTDLVPAISATPIACFGGKSTVTVSASGGTPAYTGTGDFERPAGGPYTFTVSDANGCSKTISISITQPTDLAPSASSTAIKCFGGNSTITIGASGGTAPYTGTGDFERPAGGPYVFTVTDANGCSKTTSVTITQPLALEASGTPGEIKCNGGSTTVVISASGGTLPYRGTGSFTQSAGSQSYTVTDANGCSSVVVVNIEEPGLLVATAIAEAGKIKCYGESTTVTVSATGGTLPYTGTGTFTRKAGTYTFTVTDKNNCSASTSVTITEPPLLVAKETHTFTCKDEPSVVTITASGGTEPYTGTGDFNQFDGSQTYTVTDANNCTATVVATVVRASSPLTIAAFDVVNPTPPSCCDGSASVTVTGGVGTYTYTWTDFEGNVIATNVTGIGNRCDGDFVSVTVTDSYNCIVDTAASLICIVNPPCGQLKTFTQGGWGSKPSGNNPGAYLYANFYAAFPDGITIGCGTNYFVKFTSPQQITAYLPAGSTPGPLGPTYQKTVLAGQLLAASLSVGFDNYDPNFAPSDGVLGDAYTTVPGFEGLTIREIIDIANDVIGGCRDDYKYAELNKVLTIINENYDNGTIDKGNIVCDVAVTRREGKAITATSSLESTDAMVFPNPTKGRTQIKLNSKTTEPVTVSVYSSAGTLLMKKVYNARTGSNLFDLNLGNIPSQVCIVKIDSNTQHTSRVVVVAK